MILSKTAATHNGMDHSSSWDFDFAPPQLKTFVFFPAQLGSTQ
jgi:hypothetical protein